MASNPQSRRRQVALPMKNRSDNRVSPLTMEEQASRSARTVRVSNLPAIITFADGVKSHVEYHLGYIVTVVRCDLDTSKKSAVVELENLAQAMTTLKLSGTVWYGVTLRVELGLSIRPTTSTLEKNATNVMSKERRNETCPAWTTARSQVAPAIFTRPNALVVHVSNVDASVTQRELAQCVLQRMYQAFSTLPRITNCVVRRATMDGFLAFSMEQEARAACGLQLLLIRGKTAIIEFCTHGELMDYSFLVGIPLAGGYGSQGCRGGHGRPAAVADGNTINKVCLEEEITKLRKEIEETKVISLGSSSSRSSTMDTLACDLRKERQTKRHLEQALFVYRAKYNNLLQTKVLPGVWTQRAALASTASTAASPDYFPTAVSRRAAFAVKVPPVIDLTLSTDSTTELAAAPTTAKSTQSSDLKKVAPPTSASPRQVPLNKYKECRRGTLVLKDRNNFWNLQGVEQLYYLVGVASKTPRLYVNRDRQFIIMAQKIARCFHHCCGGDAANFFEKHPPKSDGSLRRAQFTFCPTCPQAQSSSKSKSIN